MDMRYFEDAAQEELQVPKSQSLSLQVTSLLLGVVHFKKHSLSLKQYKSQIASFFELCSPHSSSGLSLSAVLMQTGSTMDGPCTGEAAQ